MRKREITLDIFLLIQAVIGLAIIATLGYIGCYYLHLLFWKVDGGSFHHESSSLVNEVEEFKYRNEEVDSIELFDNRPRQSYEDKSSKETNSYDVVIDKFEIQVIINPHHPALILEDGETYSYSKMNNLSSLIQKVVYACIMKKSTSTLDESNFSTPLVSLMIDRNPSFLVAMLGVLKAGAAYVPVDPSFPPDRQLYIFNHSNCDFIILDQHSYGHAKSLGMELPPYILMDACGNIVSMTVDVNDSSMNVSSEEIIAYRHTHHLDRLAYVLYTSGSTGKPKGVMVKNIGVINIINWFADELKVNSDSRVMGLTTFCFDISVLEMCVPLTRGATLILARSSTQKDPFTLLDIMSRHQVTLFQATPTTYEMMLATGWTGDKDIDFLVGGEACRPSVLPIVHNCRSFRNVYGPTETTIWSTSYTITSDWLLHQQALTTYSKASIVVPIGAAISETDLYIVSENEPYALMPEYAEGELWIGGVGVAAGYLNAPELTAGRFLKNPFGDGYVYRTGDIVKKLEDGTGNYVFVRRMDDQVKIGGYRIELQEIENVYLQYPAVEQAVALVRQNKLVMYLKLTKDTLEVQERHQKKADEEKTEDDGNRSFKLDINNTVVTIQAITQYSSRSLTHYMMPKATVLIDTFPQTANGKLDRKALPDPAESDFHSFEVIVPTDTDDGKEQNATCHHTAKDNHRKSSEKLSSKSQVNMVSAKSTSVMSDHIITVLEEVRGTKVKSNSSLAGLGVDSLGAVMFVHRLSLSLDGLRLKPVEIFAPDMSVKKLASVLISRLENEKPEVLTKLNISSKSTEELLEAGWNTPSKDVDEDAGEQEDIMYTEDDIKFDELISRNHNLIEGIRGALTILVLYDHFTPIGTVVNYSIRMDTALFIFMSGITTALQLRQHLRLQKHLDVDTNKEVIEECPREAFDWKWFIATRAMGILPIMWLAMLFTAPIWSQALPYHRKTDGICSVLQVTGLVIWFYKPYCDIPGPSSVIFASKILNTLILYSFIRYTIYHFQLLSKVSLSKSISSLITLLSYNKASPAIALLWMIVAFGLMAGCFAVAYATNSPVGPQIPFFFIFIFMTGNMTVSIVECCHSAKQWKEREDKKHDDVMSTNIATDNRESIINNMVKHDELWMQTLYEIAVEGLNLKHLESFLNTTLNYCEKSSILQQIWRYLPDLITVAYGLLLSPFKALLSKYSAVMCYGLTYLLVIFILVTFLQQGESRKNISVTCLESPLARVLGYMSFPVYLFQQVLFEYYTPLIGTVVNDQPFPYNIKRFVRGSDSTMYFKTLSWYYKFISVIILLMLSYIVQKYYQDGMVMKLWGHVISYTTNYKLQRRQRQKCLK